MTSALLALVLVLTPQSQTAAFEWAQIMATYDLPPATFTVADLSASDARGVEGGTDAQGRAYVVLSDTLSGEDLHYVVAHEAVHAMLRAEGAPYGGLLEERLANSFAACWTNLAGYVPIASCTEVLRMLPLRY